MLFLSSVIQQIKDLFPDLLNFINTFQPYLDFISAMIGILVSLGAFITFLIELWKKVIKPNRSFAKFVDSVYSKETRKESLKYYIPTRAQDIDPCEYDEIRENNGKYLSCLLIPFFIKDAFKDSSAGKYYLILADSGMGKTTFMLRLYRECLRKFHFPKRRNVELIPLADPKCLEKIMRIEYPEKTILLLDALDENKDAMNSYREFFAELMEETSGFYKIVITCRTQFFPNSDAEPETTGLIQIGKTNKCTEIVKKYLAPFSDEEVQSYLKKRFRFKKKLQKRAFEIVCKVPAVMARPLILNWINFLCDSQDEYKYLYQIYDTIIEKWLDREVLENNKHSLYTFSCTISNYMFMRGTTTIPARTVEKIASRNEISLEPIIARSRSLLNRNGNGEYRFAHRSFLEYFIVFDIISKLQLPENAEDIWSIGGAKQFLLEILVDSAERTDSKQIHHATQQISAYKEFSNADSITEFFQNPKLKLSHKNNDDGFTIEGWLPLIGLEGYDRNGTFNLNTFFASANGPVHCTASSKGVDIGLIFDVQRKGDDGEFSTQLTTRVNEAQVSFLV